MRLFCVLYHFLSTGNIVAGVNIFTIYMGKIWGNKITVVTKFNITVLGVPKLQ